MTSGPKYELRAMKRKCIFYQESRETDTFSRAEIGFCCKFNQTLLVYCLVDNKEREGEPKSFLLLFGLAILFCCLSVVRNISLRFQRKMKYSKIKNQLILILKFFFLIFRLFFGKKDKANEERKRKATRKAGNDVSIETEC